MSPGALDSTLSAACRHWGKAWPNPSPASLLAPPASSLGALGSTVGADVVTAGSVVAESLAAGSSQPPSDTVWLQPPAANRIPIVPPETEPPRCALPMT